MEYLQSLLENSNIPLISAFLLGLLTAVSPCPLTTNITAIGFIGKDIESKKQIFKNGIFYAAGQIFSYTLLGCILIYLLRKGTSIYVVQKVIGKYGEMFISPVLILFGILMLDVIKINLPQIHFGGEKLKPGNRVGWSAFFLGILLANAFCPTTALFYFGMLIPMSAANSVGWLLPVIYAFATGLPVILFAWILAYSVAKLGKLYNRTRIFEKWFRQIVAVVFIVIGIYYGLMMYG
jgi:cytochrome c biogenesis protein CcdA